MHGILETTLVRGHSHFHSLKGTCKIWLPIRVMFVPWPIWGCCVCFFNQPHSPLSFCHRSSEGGSRNPLKSWGSWRYLWGRTTLGDLFSSLSSPCRIMREWQDEQHNFDTRVAPPWKPILPGDRAWGLEETKPDPVLFLSLKKRSFLCYSCCGGPKALSGAHISPIVVACQALQLHSIALVLIIPRW